MSILELQRYYNKGISLIQGQTSHGNLSLAANKPRVLSTLFKAGKRKSSSTRVMLSDRRFNQLTVQAIDVVLNCDPSSTMCRETGLLRFRHRQGPWSVVAVQVRFRWTLLRLEYLR